LIQQALGTRSELLTMENHIPDICRQHISHKTTTAHSIFAMGLIFFAFF
jgi:hypothetical protein